jgi:hypothetical protein
MANALRALIMDAIGSRVDMLVVTGRRGRR